MRLDRSFIRSLFSVFIVFLSVQTMVFASGNACFNYITATAKTLPTTTPMYLPTLVEYTIKNSSGIDWRIEDASTLPSGTIIKNGKTSDGEIYCGSSTLLKPFGQDGSSCVFGFSIPAQNNLATIKGQVGLHVAKTLYTITPDLFSIKQSCPSQAATITNINPSAGSSSGGDRVTIIGTGFIPGVSSVKFNGVLATIDTTQSQTESSISVISPASVTPTKESIANVTVEIPCGLISNSSSFTYDLRPVITSIVPDVIPMSGGNSIKITGTNFDPGQIAKTTVAFGSYGIGQIISTDPTSITVTTPTAPSGTTGLVTIPVTVETPGGKSAEYKVTYASSPTISSLSSTQGPLTGESIVINGENFVTSTISSDYFTKINFAGSVLTPIFTSSKVMSVQSPTYSTVGTVSITATTPNVGTSSALSYTYDPIPTIASINPNKGTVYGGVVVKFTGTGFIPGYTRVTFGSGVGTNVSVTADGKTLTVTSPVGTAGVVPVTITTPGGTATSEFTYTDWVQTNTGLCSSLSGGVIGPLTSDSLGDVYVGGCWGVYQYPSGGTTWTPKYIIANQLDIESLIADRYNNVYAGTIDMSVEIYRGSAALGWASPWSVVLGSLGGASNVAAFCLDSNGILYAAVNVGINGYLYASNGGVNWSFAYAFPYTLLSALCVDSNGNVYIGGNYVTDNNQSTYIGIVYMYSKTGVYSGPYNIGDATNTLYSLCADTAGNIYAGTYKGLYKSADQGKNWINLGSNLRTDKVYGDTSGNIYFIGSNGANTGVFMSKDQGGTWNYLGLPGQTGYMGLTVDKNNNIWVSTYDNGVYKYSPQT